MLLMVMRTTRNNSNEYSTGLGEAPDEGMAREEPRARFKDI
jgi:hypothetical protein